jgi:hypothetical protein
LEKNERITAGVYLSSVCITMRRPLEATLVNTKMITRKEAQERVGEALRRRHDIARPTRADRELLQSYGYGPTYEPGTRYLAGAGYDPLSETEAGIHYPRLQRAQRRHREWQWHCQEVDRWLSAYFAGKAIDRVAFEIAFAAQFGTPATGLPGDASTEEVLLASMPDEREATPDLIQLPDKIPNTEPCEAAAKAIRFLWPKGVPSDKKTSEVARSVNAWIGKKLRNEISVNNVSRETVDRLLGRRGRQTARSAGT